MARLRRGAASAALAAAVLLFVPLFLLAGDADGVFLPGTQPADGSGDPAFPAFIDTLPAGSTPGTFDMPRNCAQCHQNFRRTGQRVYEPWDAWAGSMMANSARDPMFWAALDIANQDDAALGDVGVGDFCLRCHVPRAWYEGRSKCDTPWGERFDGSCLNGEPALPDNDFEGILCSVCHRSYDASNPPPGQPSDPNAPYAGNAQLFLSAAERQMLGPYGDAMPTGHTFLQSAFHRQSALCGQCHDVTHPTLNRRDPATGADMGRPMPIERTYAEYLQSRIGDTGAAEHRTCQQCHMPEPDHDDDGTPDAGYACLLEPVRRGPGEPAEGPLRTHVFAGGNSWMLGVLRAEYGPTLGGLRDAAYASGIEASLRMLQRNTATLDVTAPASVTAGETMALTARVTNLAGHKFPTGYPEGRRAWVGVTVGEDRDGDGGIDGDEIVWQSAAYDPATGRLTRDPQAKVYEAKLGIFDHNGTGECDTVDAGTGREMFHFVLNDCWVSDNRIPPLGFRPNADTTPVAYTYPENTALPGTLANWDDTDYAVPVPLTAASDLLVLVQVRYQTTSSEYVEFLRDESRSTCDPLEDGCDPTQPDARLNRGEKMHELWERYDRAPPVDVATSLTRVTLLVPPVSACCVAGACTDLEPAACAALEGRFVAGQSCAGSPCPAAVLPGEPSDLRVAKAGPLDLALAYDPACDATDHAIVAGLLSQVSTYQVSMFECGLGPGGSASFRPGTGSWWMLVVGRTAAAEGSYGRDSAGRERPQQTGARPCDLPQDLGATCR